jgi:uncharacterized protein
MKKKEKRSFELTNVEVREDGGKRQLSGYAAVFNKKSVPLYGFREVIRPGAFAKTIKEDDIRLLWNHDHSIVLGRNKSGTLRLSEDDNGLKIEADLPDTQAGRDARESISRGDVSQMSFAFEAINDRWFTEEGEDRRELIEARLFEVSPVTFPAYPDSSVSARALKASGINLDQLGNALEMSAAGQEVRADDMAALDAAFDIITSFRNKRHKPQEISREARFDLLRRQLALTEL